LATVSAPQAHFLLTFWGASQKVRRCKSAKRLLATGGTLDADARTSLPRFSLFLSSIKRNPCTLPRQAPNFPATFLFHTPSHARTVPARRAVIRKPGPRACFKRRSEARLSLSRQTCRQGSERRLQALGHCFRAAAPQAHFLLTFWSASQKVRRCKSAKRSPATGQTPDADARPKPTALLPLPLIHKKKSAHSPAKSPTSPQPSSSPRSPTLGQSPVRRAVIRKPGPRACFKRRSGARLSLPRQTCRQGSGRRLQALGHCFRAAAPQRTFCLLFGAQAKK
jgi:hypothetical protein